MTVTFKITGMSEFNKKLTAMYLRSKKEDREGAVVGFTQTYAIYVHEIQASHKPGKQWKFLESSARKLAATGELIRIIEQVYKSSKSLTKALLLAGLRIQGQAQLITPVDTGALKASAFTCKTSEENSKAQEAFAKSESVRTKA